MGRANINYNGSPDRSFRKIHCFGRHRTKETICIIVEKLDHTVAMIGMESMIYLAMKEADCVLPWLQEIKLHVSCVVLLILIFQRCRRLSLKAAKQLITLNALSSLFPCKNIFLLLMSVFAMIFADISLQPTQVTLISLFTIGIPSTFLALEPNHRIRREISFNVIKSNSQG